MCLCVWAHNRPEEGVRSPEAEVTDACEPFDKGTRNKLRSSGSHREEQQVFLIDKTIMSPTMLQNHFIQSTYLP